jgi:hypothetical protein
MHSGPDNYPEGTSRTWRSFKIRMLGYFIVVAVRRLVNITRCGEKWFSIHCKSMGLRIRTRGSQKTKAGFNLSIKSRFRVREP